MDNLVFTVLEMADVSKKIANLNLICLFVKYSIQSNV